MAKKITTSKKKVVPTKSRNADRKRVTPTTSKGRAQSILAKSTEPLVFDKQNYILMGLGTFLVIVGMLMMLGGSQPSPDVWDPNIIYGFRITVIAPIIILAGLILEIYAIFKK